MPTFDTREPITATIDVVTGAEQTRVEYANRQLVVRAPRIRAWSPRSDGGSIEVTIELPAGSHVNATAQMADFHGDGPLGDCRMKTGLGRIELETAGTLSLKAGVGDVGVGRATGHAEIATGTGDVRVCDLDGTAVIKNSNGPTWIGVAGGDLRVNSANGSIAVDVAHASVVAKSANGDVRLGDVARGSAVLETRAGDVEVGIREGTAAWLDVSARAGRVRTAL